MSSKNVIDLRKGVQKTPAPKEELRLIPERQAPRLQSQRSARVSPVRARRRRTRLIIAGVIIVLLALATYGVSWASYLPRYSVDTVTIVGANQVPSADIYNYVESLLHTGAHPFLSKDNIFLYNPKAIQREIVGYFPRIASATISRASLFSTAITVTVVERQPFALWCTDDTETNCYQMDQTGFIFAQASAPVISIPTVDASSSATSTVDSTTVSIAPEQSQQYIFEGGLGAGTSTSASSSTPTSVDSSQATSSDTSIQASTESFISPSDPIGYTFVGAHIGGIIALLQLLGQAGFTPTGATVENDQDFWVPLTEGFYIKASFGEDPGAIVSNLQLVLSSDALAGKESQLQYVDLRFGDRVYYKLLGANETQTSS